MCMSEVALHWSSKLDPATNMKHKRGKDSAGHVLSWLAKPVWAMHEQRAASPSVLCMVLAEGAIKTLKKIRRKERLTRLPQDGTGATSSLVDSSVYSRNRAFRLHLSSKWGRDVRLLPTGGAMLLWCSGSQDI